MHRSDMFVVHEHNLHFSVLGDGQTKITLTLLCLVFSDNNVVAFLPSRLEQWSKEL